MKARCTHGAPWFADCPWCEVRWSELPLTKNDVWKFVLVQRLLNSALKSYESMAEQLDTPLFWDEPRAKRGAQNTEE